MSGYLLDTNIVSELRKGSRCDGNVRAWANSIPPWQMHLSAITLAEIRQGISRIRRRDPEQARHLEEWRLSLIKEYSHLDHLLSLGAAEATAWGDLMALRPLPVLDAFLAATAQVHGLTLATRNVSDFAGLPVQVVNPFAVS